MADKFKYSDDQIKDLLDGIYAGSITEHDLPEDLYYAIADYLKSGLYSGFGGALTDFAGKDLELLQELRENIYMFSAAKTYQETKDIRDLMFNSDGDLVSNREFNQLGAQAFDQWNNDWGRTEYNTARAQAQTAGQWNEIQSSKDILPFLTYSTIGDACAICAPLDGFTAHVDDPVWDSIMPVNHFNCECIVTQEDEEAIPTPTDEKESIYNQVTGEMSDEFKMNPGKDGYIFSPEHPYFEVAPKDREYAANNFNLPIPSVAEETGITKYADVINVESKNRFDIKETATVFNSKGEILGKSLGTETQCAVPIEAQKTENCIMTHNHPSGNKFKIGDMRRIGQSFSQADMVAAIRFNMEEIRATTPEFTFIAKRPEKGWPDLDKYIKLNTANNKKVFTNFNKRIENNTTTIKKADTVHWHTVNKMTFEKLGINYTKERIK